MTQVQSVFLNALIYRQHVAEHPLDTPEIRCIESDALNKKAIHQLPRELRTCHIRPVCIWK